MHGRGVVPLQEVLAPKLAPPQVFLYFIAEKQQAVITEITPYVCAHTHEHLYDSLQSRTLRTCER